VTHRAAFVFVARRLLALAVLLAVVSFAVFALLYVTPGDAEKILLGTQTATPEALQAVRDQYHLDDSFLSQYWLWLTHAVQLDFGTSIATTLPVTDEIGARLRVSLFLGAYAYVLTMVAGIGLGIVAALRHRTVVDRGIAAVSVIGLSTPAFASGILLLYLFAIVLPWFPAAGQGVGFWDEVWHMTLPAVALAISGTALVVKHTRAAMINVLEQDYLTFARARGLSWWRILLAYGLRNALIPVVTIGGLVLAFMITGAILVEVAFSLPGIGSLLVESVTTKDLPMVQGVTLVIAVVILVANLLADLLYLVVDPRIRLGKGSA
jgi:peptide/nickel transport system permease protein